MYRRALDPSVFLTNWSYVDHLVLPPGASEGMHRHTGVEEVYYVINGEGEATVAGETTAIRKGDAVPLQLNDPHAFRNTGKDDLEFMILGDCRAEGRAGRAGNGRERPGARRTRRRPGAIVNAFEIPN